MADLASRAATKNLFVWKKWCPSTFAGPNGKTSLQTPSSNGGVLGSIMVFSQLCGLQNPNHPKLGQQCSLLVLEGSEMKKKCCLKDNPTLYTWNWAPAGRDNSAWTILMWTSSPSFLQPQCGLREANNFRLRLNLKTHKNTLKYVANGSNSYRGVSLDFLPLLGSVFTDWRPLNTLIMDWTVARLTITSGWAEMAPKLSLSTLWSSKTLSLSFSRSNSLRSFSGEVFGAIKTLRKDVRTWEMGIPVSFEALSKIFQTPFWVRCMNTYGPKVYEYLWTLL